MKYLALLIISCFILSGCLGHIIEGTKSIAGVSTKSLEEARSRGVSQVFEADRAVCFDAALSVLKEMGGYIYMQNKKRNIIVAMDLEKNKISNTQETTDIEYDYIDTTQLGVFFSDAGANKTKIELSSLSTSLLERTSERFFSLLVKKVVK